MIDHPRPAFRVSCSELIRAEIRALGERATRLGLGPSLAAALREMGERLEKDPLNWGDPQRYLRKANPQLFHRGWARLLSVSYAVDEQHRVVYLQRVVPLPSSPLASE